ncbi:MAG: hypothetical protein J5965_07495 [Aeriscardovia sp.]|nr:hypothetical protein [Aeriscardovia sp.]
MIQQEDEQFYGGYVYTCDDSEIKMIYLTYYYNNVILHLLLTVSRK